MDISYRDELASIHYDMYKDVHNIRPRWYNYQEMTVEDLQKELDLLDKQMDQVIEERKEEEKQAIKAFENTLFSYIEAGAGNKTTALRWIIKEEILKHEQDIDHLLYNLGLLFTDYGKDLKVVIKHIIKMK